MIKRDLYIYQSNSFKKTYTFSYDITSLSYYAQIRDKDKNLIADFSITKSGNSIILTLARSTVDALTIGEYIWELKEVSGTDETPVLSGAVIVTYLPTETP